MGLLAMIVMLFMWLYVGLGETCEHWQQQLVVPQFAQFTAEDCCHLAMTAGTEQVTGKRVAYVYCRASPECADSLVCGKLVVSLPVANTIAYANTDAIQANTSCDDIHIDANAHSSFYASDVPSVAASPLISEILTNCRCRCRCRYTSCQINKRKELRPY